MKVPFIDLAGQYRQLEKPLGDAIRSVLESGQFILGDELRNFEDDFARFCMTRYAVGVDSGVSALELSLRACGIGEGDEVIIPAQTFIATASAVSFTGATPVLVDVDEQIYTIKPQQIERAITQNTRAIMPVHLYGQMADMEVIQEIASRHGLIVIEDAAQAHGATYHGEKAGSVGKAGCFSFYPAKNLGAFGDGGIVVTDNGDLAEKIRMLRNYGQKEKYDHRFLAFNRRLDTLQAAVLRVKLKHLEQWNEERREIARAYKRQLENLPLVLPAEAPHCRHVYHLFVILTPQREELRKYLQERGVACGLHYPSPIHLQKAYRSLPYRRGDFPVAERVASECLSLPLFPGIGEERLSYTIKTIKGFYTR
ncbi:MAG: DegT/DnrJ/EryC1/StrS family aminotransferase [PVC group bacterium]